MNDIDDTTLAAYMDGELDLVASRQVERALAQDAALQERLERMRAADAAVRAAFDRVAQLPAPPLRAPVVAMHGAHGARGRWLLPLSVAASLLALTCTGLVAYQLGQLRQERLARVEEARAAAMDSAFQRVIDQELSGTTVQWQSPDGGAHAEFTPVRTWRTETGRYCREFTELRVVEGRRREQGGVACRNDDGRWQVRVRYYPG